MGCAGVREQLEEKMMLMKLERMEIQFEKAKYIQQLSEIEGHKIQINHIPDYIDPKFAREKQTYDDDKTIRDTKTAETQRKEKSKKYKNKNDKKSRNNKSHKKDKSQKTDNTKSDKSHTIDKKRVNKHRNSNDK